MQSRPTIGQSLAHKTVFLTGDTGFVGKAVIEKLFRSVPLIHKIYVLIRPRDNQSADDRLHGDILSSPLFDRLRRERDDFVAFFESKVTAVAGDVTSPMLGLSDSDLSVLRDSVQITIHSAASVKFNDPLDVAVRANCEGSVRVLDFVHSCPRVECHVHVSTAFVNTNQRDGDKTTVREQLYPLGFDVEEVFAAATNRATSAQEIQALRDRITGSYPNTYVLTKAMSEHLLVARARPTLPLVILRPTVIGSTWQDPMPGFIDQVAGVPSMFLAVGMGIVTAMVGDENNLVDMVPLDLLVNTMLASIAYSLTENEGRVWPLIVHSGSSDPRENPVEYARPNRTALEYFQAHPPVNGVFKPALRAYKSPSRFRVAWFCKYELRLSTLSALATLTQCRRLRKKAQDLQRLTRRAEKIVDSFRPFTTHQWVFQADTVAMLRERFDTDRDEWWLTARKLNWDLYTRQLCMGLKKYVQKEEGIEIVPPKDSGTAHATDDDETEVYYAQKMYLVASEGKLRQNREANPPVDSVGQPRAEVVAQMGRKCRMPRACHVDGAPASWCGYPWLGWLAHATGKI